MSNDALALLGSTLTDAEFMAGMAQGKNVRECRRYKGFPHMERLGMIGQQTPCTGTGGTRHATAADRRQIAEDAALLVNEQSMNTSKAAKQIGVSDTTLRNYWREFGIKILAPRVRKGTATEAVCRRVIELVNDDGYRISHAAVMAGSNCVTVRIGLSRLGMKYNARKIKIERIGK